MNIRFSFFSDFNKKYLFSRSSWSLVFIAKLRNYFFEKPFINEVRVLVPFFYCNITIDVLKQFNCRIFYYEVDDTLSPLIPDLCSKIDNNNIDIFVGVHFFGKEYDFNWIKEILTQKNCWFVEDATHVFIPYGKIGVNSNFTLYSPYKFFGTPTAAILHTNMFEKENSFVVAMNFVEGEMRKCHVRNEKFNFINSNLYAILFIGKKIMKFILRSDVNRSIASFSNNKKSTYYPTFQIDLISRTVINYFSRFFIHRRKMMYNKKIKLVGRVFAGFLFDDIGWNKYLIVVNILDVPKDDFCYLELLNRDYLGLTPNYWPDLPAEVLLNSESSTFKKTFMYPYIYFEI